MRGAIIALLLTAAPGLATSYALPTGPRELYSPSREFVLVEDISNPVVSIYRVADRTRPVWTYLWPESHAAVWLSDDGEVVVTAASGWIKEQEIPEVDAVAFRNRAGVFRRYPLRDLCPDPPRLKDVERHGPIGDFWRSWAAEKRVEGDVLVVRTTRGWEFRFGLPEGELLNRSRVGRRAWVPWAAVATVLVIAAAGVVWARQRRPKRKAEPPAAADNGLQ